MEHMQPAEDMEIMQVMQAMQPTQMPLISMPPGLPSGMAHGVAGQCAIFGCGRPGLVDGVPSFYCETHMQQSNPSELLVGSAQPSAAAAVLMAAQQKAAGGLCQLPGCSTPVWVDLQGVHHQYCGKMHMIQHQSGIGEAVTGSLIYNPPGLSSAPPTLANPCLVCNCREQWPGSSFCAQDCSQMARAQAPGLLEIPVTHPKFKEIENEFKSTWVWRPVPAVKAIYMILTKETDQKNFRDYRDMVEAKNNHKSHGAPADSRMRPILLNKVIVGKGYSANGLFSRFTAPPVGYDSSPSTLLEQSFVVLTVLYLLLPLESIPVLDMTERLTALLLSTSDTVRRLPAIQQFTMAVNPFDLDEEFYESCLNISKQLGNQLPISTTSSKLDLNKGSVVSDSSRLTDRYLAAYKDFFGMPSGAPCIYKSGPAWPERKGPQAQRFIREARPVYGHPIAGSWLKVGMDIYKLLDSCSIMWTSIDPVAFANAGEKTPFCPLLMWIGVKHKTLLFDDAVAAANAIKRILSLAGFPEIEVAFRESEVIHSVGGPKLLPFNPLVDPIPEFHKPFIPTLGLSIAPLKTPHYEGTGALYFRLSKDDNERVILLTAAHVACPPPMYANRGMSHKQVSQRREEIVALGSMGYRNATNAMMATIGDLARSFTVWKKVTTRLGEFADGEDAAVTEKPKESQRKVEKATKIIYNLNKLHDGVTKRRTNPEQRIIGFVLHAESNVIANGPI
ncbi:hypothetical protein FRC17_003821, partial [Serendipita sp. 399]